MKCLFEVKGSITFIHISLRKRTHVTGHNANCKGRWYVEGQKLRLLLIYDDTQVVHLLYKYLIIFFHLVFIFCLSQTIQTIWDNVTILLS